MTFHRYEIREIFSSADGTIQYIELGVGNFNNEHFWAGHDISASNGGAPHVFEFESNLPSGQTANTTVLLATQGFANLGLVTPDFIIPPGFLFTAGGTVNFAGADTLSMARRRPTAIRSTGTASSGSERRRTSRAPMR